jgi:3-methylcrotonyl-CoA carboxylase alpha subunit/acetyl-CoA/propionyl-CoA carboxylase biotin carboxyl carrier protein
MLGKVIAHGATREAARRTLVAALDDTAIFGVTTNLGFVRDLVASDAFRDAAIDTAWLDRGGFEPDATAAAEATALALCAAAWAQATAAADGAGADPFGAGDGWRLGGPPAPVDVELDAGTVRVDVAAGTVEHGGRRWEVRPMSAEPGRLRLEIDGAVHAFQVETGAHEVTVGHRGEAHVFHRPAAFDPATTAAADGSVLAPMPGTVLSVSAAPGQEVREGDTLVVLEAMKMELSLTAPFDGSIGEVGVAAGDRVALGQTLFEVVADD